MIKADREWGCASAKHILVCLVTHRRINRTLVSPQLLLRILQRQTISSLFARYIAPVASPGLQCPASWRNSSVFLVFCCCCNTHFYGPKLVIETGKDEKCQFNETIFTPTWALGAQYCENKVSQTSWGNRLSSARR